MSIITATAISPEEVNLIAKTFIKLRKRAERLKSADAIKKYKDYQNYAASKLFFIVKKRTSRYKKFANHEDLQQDGLEALILALKTYNPKKGDFGWWAKKYVDTRVSRAANAHSTIRFPLKKAKELQPYKTTSLPVMIDLRNPHEHVETSQIRDNVMRAIKTLPDTQQKAILMAFEFGAGKGSSVSKISKELDISRPMCVKLLQEAKESLKLALSNIVVDEIK